MEHIYLFLADISITIGFFSLMLLLLLYHKFRHPLFKNALLLLAPFHGAVFIIFIETYLVVNLPTFYFNAGFNALYYILLLAGFGLIPYASHKMVSRGLSLKAKMVCLISAIICLICFVLEAILAIPLYSYVTAFIAGVLLYSYSIRIILTEYYNITLKELKRFVTFFMLLSLLVIVIIIPVFIIDQFFPDPIFFFYFKNTLIIYYLINSILIAFFSGAYFFKPESEKEQGIALFFIDSYGITKREKQVVELIIEGYTSHAIGERLHISKQTVKNYTNNIYRKTGVNSKIELVNRVKESITI